MTPSKKIMIVDDEIEFRKLFSMILTKEGYDVIVASNGIECLELAENANLDLIILDVYMPGMDGYETIKRLRQIKKLNFTPIVFLTGVGTSPRDIDAGYLLGGSEYWTKPISIQELIVRVRSVLRMFEAEKQVRKLQQSFYSMVVHDLRNPIGAILGFTELMLEDKDSLTKDHLEMISEINSASVHLLQIAKNLLEFSEIESGEYILHRQTVSLSDIVKSVFDKLKVMRLQKNITIEIQIETLASLNVDPDRFSEVIENLFDNALRFTPMNGKISIIARHHLPQNSSNSDSIRIEIADTGSGIGEEEIPTLFNKNRIMNPKYRKEMNRTGLGLVICREIIEAHGGTINVESTVGKGSKFIISLPV